MLSAAGFEKLRDRKYLAPVAGITEETLGMPARVVRGLATQGYNTDRARVAPVDEETLGLYSGVLVDVNAQPDLPWGVNVPVAEQHTTTRRVASEGAEYVALHRQDEVERVVITLADDDPHVAQALNLDVVSSDGLTAWRDQS